MVCRGTQLFVGFGWTPTAVATGAGTSPFTASLMEVLARPNIRAIDFRLAFRKVMERAKEVSQGRCCPWMESAVDTPYFCL